MAVPLIEGVVPVTMTVNVPPTLLVQLSVLDPEPPVIMPGVSVHMGPVGDTAYVSVTVPVNPLTGSMSIVVVPETLGVVLIIAGLANIWKSTAWTVTRLLVWLSGPLTPVKVIV
jgi:hypothetical protein